MRITRLLLARFGHLTDVEMTFPADGKLQVVLGPNEAGKSTALAAIGDALYGFPHRTPFAFLHDQSDLRIAFDLAAADGMTHGFVRTKRRKDDLTDAAGRPIPESALIAVRGGQDRKFFEDMFGLDGRRLREGGNAILSGEGEVGTTIFQASSGLHRAPAAMARLKEQADALYTPRRVASRAFYQAVDAHKAARDDLAARSLRSDVYEAARDERVRLDTTITRNADRERAHKAERRRLERIRRTLPALRALAQAAAELAALGAVPSLPADARTQRQDAIFRRDVALQTVEREEARRTELVASHQASLPDAALLAEGEMIDALARRLASVDDAIRDRTLQEIEAAQHARAIEQFARDLGLSGEADAIVARMPTAVDRAALRRLVRDHAGLTQRLTLATDRAGTAKREAEVSAAAVAELPPPIDTAPLAAALAAARAEGRIDDEIDRAEAAFVKAAESRIQALVDLPLWMADAAALRTAPIPATPLFRRHEEALAAADAALRDAAGEIARLDRELVEATDRLIEIAAGEALPTESALAAARDRRDLTWRLIRRHHLDGGAAPTEAERASLPSLPLADALEMLTRDADRIADRRTAEAKRISDHEQAEATRQQRVAARDRAASAHARALAHRDAQHVAWQSIWSAAGIVAGDPGAMREWLAARKDVLTALAAEEEARRRLTGVVSRRDAARTALAALVPATPDPRLAPLLRTADALLAEATKAATAHAEAMKRDSEARRVAGDCARELDAAATQMREWQDAWRRALSDASLPAGMAAEDAETSLSLWERISVSAQDRNAARTRVAEMSGHISAFARQVTDLATRVAPDLADAAAGPAITALAARLRAARDLAAEQARHGAALEKLAAEIAEARDRGDAAERVLAALRHMAGVDTDDDLAATIDRVERHAALAREILRHETDLRSQGDGVDLATLHADAADADLDGVAARIDEIDRDLSEWAETSNAARLRLGQIDAELDQMQKGQNAAEAAQRMEDHAAEAADVAARYVRVRLAGALLKAGLDRYRREQQDPLLNRAGAHFAKLTDGRYARLEVIEDNDGKQAIVAIASVGTRCPVVALSEGTRDQLYLALRLAAIEDYASRSTPLPFIADDLLVQFDDARARAAIAVLADLSSVTQVILFTHHAHVASMVTPDLGHVQHLPGSTLPETRVAAQ